MSYSQAQDEAARRLAIRNGPPAIATIDAFDATIHEGLAHEVALATQIDRQEVTTGWALLHGNPSRVLIVPLRGTAPGADTLGAAVIPASPGESSVQTLERVFPREASRDAQRAQDVVQGLRIHRSLLWGRVSGVGEVPPIIVRPFEGPRIAVLSEERDHAYVLPLAIMAAVAGLTVFTIGVLRSKGDGTKPPKARRPYTSRGRQMRSVKARSRFAEIDDGGGDTPPAPDPEPPEAQKSTVTPGKFRVFIKSRSS